jgi:hypothetical protein
MRLEFGFGSFEHADVRREMDQLITRAAGNGILFQISFKAIK